MTDDAPLTGIRVLSLAVNVPGPVAAARLRDLGATVTKVEPPGGDFLASAARAWYDAMCHGQHVVSMNLKDAGQRAALDAMLDDTDVLIVSSRPSALARLQLSPDALLRRHPNLCIVSIVGHLAPHEEEAGHDLTYQSEAGLIDAAMPPTLVADMAAAEEAVTEALALLLRRTRTGHGGVTSVGLCNAAARMALPRTHGLTRPGGILGGGLPVYSLYDTADGTLAVAALEPHFAERLAALLDVAAPTHEAFAAIFATRRAAEWATWGRTHDIPMVEVPPASQAPASA